jgi:hypothetical protein
MARQIRKRGNGFYYHGIDTIADLCSGDFAMGLDLVQKIFQHSKTDWRAPARIPALAQHTAVHEFATHESDTILYQAPRGKEKYDIVERLSWMAHQYAMEKTTEDGKPVVKTHLDIDEDVLSTLMANDPRHYDLFMEMVRDGIMFPLNTSRSARKKVRTRRFMVRRILLAIHRAPLGRGTPIKFHDVQRLQALLSEPREWTTLELQRTYDDSSETNQMPDRSTDTPRQTSFDFGK